MGLDGIGASTVLCQTGVLVYSAWVSAGSTCFADFRPARLVPDLPVIRELLGQIAPGSARLLVIAVGGFVAQLWLRADGDAAVAGYNVGLRLEQLLLLPAIGITAAIGPLASQNLGAQRPDRVRSAFWWGVGLAVALLVAGAGGVWAVGSTVTGFFGAGPEAEAMALDYLHVESVVFPLFGILFGLQNLLQGMKRPYWPLAVGLWRQGLAILVFGWIYVELLGLGAYGVWLSVASAAVTGTLLMMLAAWFELPRFGIHLFSGSRSHPAACAAGAGSSDPAASTPPR